MTLKKNNAEHKTERPPIVVVLGHVDHGKSTLLDYIRKTNTTEKEAGGITQHISAYEIMYAPHTSQIRADKKSAQIGADNNQRKSASNSAAGRRITFIDTPGHKAFSHMRQRGVNLADVAILVVSGEDGVKEQTLEVLKTIREGNIPYVVAINKIDKPNINIERIKQNLAEHEVFVEGYGDSIPSVAVSAKTGAGISELLDMVLLVAELEELRGDPTAPLEGFTVESHVSPRQGVTATIIITNGTLRRGVFVGTDNSFAPVRKIDSFLNHDAETATFSSPVIIAGFNTVPDVGASVRSFESKKEALEHIQNATIRASSAGDQGTQRARNSADGRNEMDDAFFVPLIVKADTTGSLEALSHEILKLESNGQKLKVVQQGVGTIEESDVKTASGNKHALVVGLHVGISKTAEKVALQHGVTMAVFNIIYKLTEWLSVEVQKRTPKTMVEKKIGSAKIIKIFSRTKEKQVVGGKVQEGEITVKGIVKIIRRGKEIGGGEIIELQQQKKRVRTVEAGLEFGALIESKFDIAPGDSIEEHAMVEQ